MGISWESWQQNGVTYTQRDIIFQEGDIGSTMYIIWSGRVAIIKGDFNNPLVFGEFGPGDIFGEMALLESEPRSASIVALDKVDTLEISRRGFEWTMKHNPSIGFELIRILSSRLRIADSIHEQKAHTTRYLIKQVSLLQMRKEELLALQRLRQETIDFIVHDLRSPLGTIMGVLNMLEMVLPEDIIIKNSELLSLATTSCQRMNYMVSSLLDVAKMESGQARLDLTKTHLADIIHRVARKGLTLSQQKSIIVDETVLDTLPLIKIDADKIERILANLIDNAIKYTLEGKMVTIATELKDDHIVVKVIDQGPGIPHKMQKTIFDRFVQVKDDKKASYGFGIGLYFCRLTIEAHGGKIWVEDCVNDEGSCFIFTLPLKT
ncbi:MAG: hypothetical protein B6242_09655 [Anaerolineaceae bacterium 4572_78]|nr:MAG: hypothetical protein B6242_09655 [Anaerolineaceae bacterium 4572_78]